MRETLQTPKPRISDNLVSIQRSTVEVRSQIQDYIDGQPDPKRADLDRLHQLNLEAFPGCKLWFTHGKNDDGKVVANPNIGYGSYTINYADGSSREFYRVGMSANTSGISVYIMGLADKAYLAKTFGESIGKATVTGYSIKFKSLSVINVDVLMEALQFGMELERAK